MILEVKGERREIIGKVQWQLHHDQMHWAGEHKVDLPQPPEESLAPRLKTAEFTDPCPLFRVDVKVATRHSERAELRTKLPECGSQALTAKRPTHANYSFQVSMPIF